ncbi:MAG: threonine/serine exporter family protein, partial [Bacillota bacterium]|nr:threonine/serine exporter family protein [Bacillota bacterium]
MVPFVPGFGMYNTMLALVEQDYPLAVHHGASTFFIGLSIAFALTIMLSVNTYRKAKTARNHSAARAKTFSPSASDLYGDYSHYFDEIDEDEK